MHFRLARSKGIFTWHCYVLQAKSGWSRTSMNTIASLYQAFQKKNEGKRYSKAPSDTLRERKEAYMHPKSAEEVFVRMPDSLSDAKMVNKAALDCPDAPLGRHKVGETFPKSAGCTLEEQKRPKVLPKGFGAS